MILAASLVVRNERDRYLPLVIEHLRAFVDQISVLDDGSTDGTLDYLHSQIDGQLSVTGNPAVAFDQHEGRVRQALLNFTLSRKPTHVLAIDADELIEDGAALRALVEQEPDVPAWTLSMAEVWKVDENALYIRSDGAWGPWERVQVWTVPEQVTPIWRIAPRKLACSPVPIAATRGRTLRRRAGQRIFHFGWADPATRQARFDRYMNLDGGRFHARTHLQSIMFPEDRIRLQSAPWPDAAWSAAVRAKLTP